MQIFARKKKKLHSLQCIQAFAHTQEDRHTVSAELIRKDSIVKHKNLVRQS